MKKFTVAFVALLSLAATVFAGPYDAWTKFRNVTINTTAAGAGVQGAVTDFPLLVRLTSAGAATGGDVLTEALAGGADLRFMSASGVPLSYQIEQWATNNAEIWVRVPVVAGNAATTIRMFWGNAAASSESSGPAVFDTAAGYQAVWHMNAASNANELDATLNAFTARDTNGVASAAGAIGLARTFVGGSGTGTASGTAADNDAFIVDGTATGKLNFPENGTYTLSGWFNRSDADANRTMIAKGDNQYALKEESASPFRWEMQEFNTTGVPHTGWHSTFATATNSVWQHVIGVRNGPTQLIYLNGVLASSAIAGSTSGTGRITTPAVNLGKRSSVPGGTAGTQYYAGLMDEVRMANVSRSADYARLDYETQKAAVTAVTLGATVTASSSRFAYVVDTALGTVGTAFNLTPAFTGALTGATMAPSPPAGITFSAATGVISGTPTAVSGSAQYIITATLTGPAATVADTIVLRVRGAALSGVDYGADTTTYFTGVGIAANTPVVTATTGPAAVDSFLVAPPLPAGLILNKTSGQITGTPGGALAAANYVVTAFNEAGNAARTLRFTVSGAPTIAYAEASVSYAAGLATPISAHVPVTTGTVVTWSISPSLLPAGLSFNTATGVLSGNPTASAGAADYIISAINPAGTSLDTINITVSAPESYGTWTGLKTFNLNTSAAAAGVTEALGGFPALVRLGPAHGAIFGGANADGSDIRFSKPDGTRLAYEIDRWNAADSTAAIWVLLDTVLAAGATPLRIHYGNGAATGKSDGSRVFTSNSGYLGVWHMGNPAGGNAQTGARPNAKSPGTNDAVPTNLTGGWVTKAGIIGLSDTLPGTGTTRNGSGFSLGALPAGTITNGAATLSGWMAYGGAPITNLWRSFVTLAQDTVFGTANAAALGTAGTGVGRFGFQVANNSNTTWQSSATNTWTQNAWFYLTVSIRNGLANDSLYVNGAFAMPNTATEQSLGDVNRPFNFIGKNFIAGDATYIGKMDEVRMSNVSRTRHWAKLEYKNQKPGVAPVFDLAYSAPSYTFLEEQLITPIPAPTVAGGATRYAVSPALPAGLVLNPSTGAIAGTPVDGAALQAYTVTAFGDSAWSTTAAFNLTVTTAPPAGLDYAADTISTRVGFEITPNVPSFTGTIATWVINPTLPNGLSLSATGVISGTPAAAAATTEYRIIGTGPSGIDTAFVVITVAAPAEDYSTWANNRNIIINTTATGANVAGTVTNYPLLVRLGAGESAVFTQALAAGADVRFTKANGVTRLPHEIVGWNATTRKAEIWVMVDSVKGNTTQTIRMRWGKAGAADSSSGGSVFNAGNGFASVWHLGNAPDSSARPNAVTGAPPAVPTFPTGFPGYGPTPGVIGMADTLRGGAGNVNTDYLRILHGTPHPGFTGYDSFPGGFTISVWANPARDSAGAGFHRFLDLNTDNATSAANRIFFGRNGTVNNGNAGVFGRLAYRVSVAATSGGLDANDVPASNISLGTNTWQYFTLVKSNSSAVGTMYKNGVAVAAANTGTQSASIPSVSRPYAWIGHSFDGGNSAYGGQMDEVRLAKTTRNADWIKLDYETQQAYQIATDIGLQAPTLAYAPDSVTYQQGTAITALTPVVAGTGVTYTGSVPAGLSLAASTGVITGIPTVAAATAKFTITATNAGGSVTDSLFITVTAAPAPVIGSAPRDTTVISGGPVSFTVGATVAGGGVLSYQWRKNGTNVTTGTGGTTATYSLAAAAIADTGAYTVVVTSTLNATTQSTTSGAGLLRVNIPPTVATQPAASQNIVLGGTITLTAAAGTVNVGSSSGAITYQWRKGTTNLATNARITSVTAATLTITGAVIGDTGTGANSYNVVITRTLNGTTRTVTSNNAAVQGPVSIMPGSFVFRVSGADKPYAFVLPAGAGETQEVTMSIGDAWGRTIWTRAIHPKAAKENEVIWNGRTSTGLRASAGMYVMRIAVVDAAGQTTNYVRKAVTLKPK